MMVTEQEKGQFRAVIDEVFNKGRFDVIPNIFHPDFIEHQFGLHAGYQGLKSDVQFLRNAFPDLHLTIEDMSADNDKLFVRMTARGTNLGGIMGPPNGKQFEIAVFDEVRFENGKIVEHWGSPDRFAQMAQLGLLPRND
jgi:predicted ester cyclase